MPALVTSETSSKKPSPRMKPSESSRLRIMAQTPEACGALGACQMRSSALCSSANTVVAPMMSTTMLTAVATSPWVGWLALSISACTPAAPSWPIRPESWPISSPCTASRPQMKPATAITMMSSGAMENTV